MKFRKTPRRRFEVDALEPRRLLSGISTVATFVPAPNGINPESSLVMDANGNLFGTTSAAGAYNQGTAFEVVKGSGVPTTLVSFQYAHSDLVIDSKGNLYGESAGGGADGQGTLFEIVKGSHDLTTLYSFTGGADGSAPTDGIVVDSAGDLFGDTSTVFELVKGSHQLTLISSFTDPSIGQPYSEVVDSRGNIFGLTTGDGSTTFGTIFEIAKQPGGYSSAETTLASFDTAMVSPNTLIEDKSGNFYGVESSEGSGSTVGGIFELAKGSGTITILAALTSNQFGGPSFDVTLALDSTGNLFGTNVGQSGQFVDPQDNGSVFELPKGANTVTTLYSFTGSTDGGSPQAGVILDSAGNIYGSSFEGGSEGWGSVYELKRTGTTYAASVNTVVSFVTSIGAGPTSGLTQDSAGDFFGTTYAGGVYGYGSVYEIAKGSATITTLASFNFTDGAFPEYDSLATDSKGDIFGDTTLGANGTGTVFEIAKGNGAITTLISFGANDVNGSGGLALDKSGDLFVEDTGGGTFGDGALLEIAKGSTAATTVASFNGANGSTPSGGLTFDSKGNLFGTTATAVFELAKESNTISDVSSVPADGSEGTFQGGLVFDSAGNLFGTTAGSRDGASFLGMIFEIAKGSSQLRPLYFFEGGSDGSDPLGSLLADGRGNLYGTTYSGGDESDGTVYELSKVGAAYGASDTILATFDDANGSMPCAGLTTDSAGNLFGTASFGGTLEAGLVFEIPPTAANDVALQAIQAGATRTPARGVPSGTNQGAAINPTIAPAANTIAPAVLSSGVNATFSDGSGAFSEMEDIYSGVDYGPNGYSVGVASRFLGRFITDFSITADAQSIRSTGTTPSTNESVNFGIASVDEFDGIYILTAQGVASTQTVRVSDDVHAGTVSASVPLLDQNNLGLTAAVSASFTVPSSVGAQAYSETQLSGNGNTNALTASGDLQSGSANGEYSIAITGSLDHVAQIFFGHPYQASLDQIRSLTVTGLPATTASTLASIAASQGKNTTAGLGAGIGGLQSVLVQDALASLPAMSGFPAAAYQLLDNAVLGSLAGVGKTAQVTASTGLAATASFDNGSATQDVNAQAAIASTTTLLPSPAATQTTGNLAFSVQSLSGGAATAAGPVSGGIALAADASSASLSASTALPGTDANGNSLGNVNAAANLQWKRTAAPASFLYTVNSSSSSTGNSVEFNDQITFPATVTGTISASLPGFAQPPLTAGSLSQSGDLLINTTTPAAAAPGLFSTIALLPALTPANTAVLLGLLNMLDSI